MEWTEFIRPELAVLIPALYLLGMALKNWGAFADKHIPLTLMGGGVLLAGLWLAATGPLATGQDVAMLVFGAIVQGVLCAGAAVLGNQIWKQEGAGAMKVAIDAAHGGRDAGVRAFGRQAKDDTLRLAEAVKAALKRCEAKVVMTRGTDATVTDTQRAETSNAAKADMVLSIDRASGPVGQQGIVFWGSSSSGAEEMRRLSKIAAETASVAAVPYTGVKRGYPGNPNGDYKINRDTAAPSLLAQLLHITDKADNAIFEEKMADYAEALCRGICGALGGEYSPPVVAPPAKKVEGKKGEGEEASEKE